MNQFELAIQSALKLSGSSVEANKAYLEFIKANFIIPINKSSTSSEPEVLYLQTEEHTFLPVFSSKIYLDQWAIEIQNEIDILTLTGVNLLKSIGDDVTVSMNINSSLYKEFNPSELARMRSMVLKLFK